MEKHQRRRRLGMQLLLLLSLSATTAVLGCAADLHTVFSKDFLIPHNPLLTEAIQQYITPAVSDDTRQQIARNQLLIYLTLCFCFVFRQACEPYERQCLHHLQCDDESVITERIYGLVTAQDGFEMAVNGHGEFRCQGRGEICCLPNYCLAGNASKESAAQR